MILFLVQTINEYESITIDANLKHIENLNCSIWYRLHKNGTEQMKYILFRQKCNLLYFNVAHVWKRFDSSK